jgi:hypothetical protein
MQTKISFSDSIPVLIINKLFITYTLKSYRLSADLIIHRLFITYTLKSYRLSAFPAIFFAGKTVMREEMRWVLPSRLFVPTEIILIIQKQDRF